MNKGIFSAWFREFATLVFTQTVQAFLLAIVMSIIVSCLAGANGNGINAAGLLAIIALSSFGKIELLVKNIFGVTSGFGDPSLKNGKGITAAGMLAYRGAQRLGDNISKAREGKRMIEQGKMGLRNIEASNLNPDTSGSVNNGEKNTNENQEQLNLQNDVAHQVGEQVVKLETLGDINALTQAIQRLTTETSNANRNTTKDKVEGDRAKYENMIQEGKNLKRSAVRENIGAAVGGTAGVIAGLAQGENVASTALSGAGFGDALGQKSAGNKAKKEQYNKDMQKLTEDYQKKIGDYTQKVMDNANDIYQNGGDDIEYRQQALTSYKNNLKQAESNIEKAKSVPKSRAVKKNLKNIQDHIDKNTNAGS